jgi:hypothetical protein
LSGCRACNAAGAGEATGSTLRTEEGPFWNYQGGAAVRSRARSRRGRFKFGVPGLAKRHSEQARAKQHKAGCGYREESFGYEIIVTHDAPADRDAGPNLLKLSESLFLQNRPRTIALKSVRKKNAGADEAEKHCNHLDHRNCP